MAKILIVEDDAAVAQQLAAQLKQRGHVCGIHARGERVVDIVRREEVDLLILDIMLPGPSGFQVCREIRSDKTLYTLPIMFISAMANPEEVKHGLDQGADTYITKPFSITEVVQRVDALVRSNVGSDLTDSLTGLANAEGTRKAIQQHLSRGETFGLAYIEMLGLREFAKLADSDGQQKALRHLARANTAYAEDAMGEDAVVGHLGGGYFITLVSLDQIREFCDSLLNAWTKHKQHLYESCELNPDKIAQAESRGLLELCICVTLRDGDDLISANQLLETVSRIRETVPKNSLAGAHFDRRMA